MSCQLGLAKQDSIFIGVARRDTDMAGDPQVLLLVAGACLQVLGAGCTRCKPGGAACSAAAAPANQGLFPSFALANPLPQQTATRTYYLSNGVVRVSGRRVSTSAAQYEVGDLISVLLDADQVSRWVYSGQGLVDCD